MAVWYFGKPRIPLSALALSFGALLVPVITTFWFPDSSHEYELLLWLLALVPAFLLAYYRGWNGVAVAMLVGMVVLCGVQILVLTLGLQTDWVLLLAVTAAYISIGLTVGLVSELLHQERARAERLALQDDLTDFPNRRLADLFLDKEFSAATRGRPLSVVLFDLDGFKAYNDRHGHTVGDDALRAFADVLRGRTRRMDLSARYGGEEFITVLSGDIDGASSFAETIRQTTARLDHVPPFTVSAGVAEFTGGMTSVAELVSAADRALYEAKAGGRDRVVASSRQPA